MRSAELDPLERTVSNGMSGKRNENRRMLNIRGVALLIVLLVTALLIALIFEFAYGTRVSLRAAVNFRDGQRAYFVARSGVNVVGKILSDKEKNNKLQDNLEQKEWLGMPIGSSGDTELRVRWEDEGGKINIGINAYNASLQWFKQLLEDNSISQSVVEKISEEKSNKINLVAELYQVMSDEEYGKVKDFLTVFSSSQKININTAPEDVLKSLGMSSSLSSLIIDKRARDPFEDHDEVKSFSGMDTKTAGFLNETSDVFKVFSYATVGEYTRQIEAVIKRDTSEQGFSVLYWRAL